MNPATRQLESPGQVVEAQIEDVDASREVLLPDPPAVYGTRQWELNQVMQLAHEGVLEVLSAIGGEDGRPLEPPHPLQQTADLNLGVAVVSVLDFRTPAEQGVGLVEETQAFAELGGIKDQVEVLLGLTDVLLKHP